MKYVHQLIASAAEEHVTERTADTWLTEHGVTDPTTRIAVKLSLQASGGQLATDQVPAFDLASDRARQPVPGGAATPELDRMVRRAGLDPAGYYTDHDVTEAFRASDLGIEDRIAVRHHLASTGRLRAGAGVTPTPRPGMSATREMSALI
jgi:hypothetical protein